MKSFLETRDEIHASQNGGGKSLLMKYGKRYMLHRNGGSILQNP